MVILIILAIVLFVSVVLVISVFFAMAISYYKVQKLVDDKYDDLL